VLILTFKDYSKKLKLTQHLNKEINVNFYGGEMKRSEVLQILLQNKNLLLLDEVDAGLDIENLKLIGQILEEYLSREKTALIVTHTGQILKYINANRFLLLLEGKLYEIPRNYPGKEILKNIAIKGYKKFVSSLK